METEHDIALDDKGYFGSAQTFLTYSYRENLFAQLDRLVEPRGINQFQKAGFYRTKRRQYSFLVIHGAVQPAGRSGSPSALE